MVLDDSKIWCVNCGEAFVYKEDVCRAVQELKDRALSLANDSRIEELLKEQFGLNNNPLGCYHRAIVDLRHEIDGLFPMCARKEDEKDE